MTDQLITQDDDLRALAHDLLELTREQSATKTAIDALRAKVGAALRACAECGEVRSFNLTGLGKIRWDAGKGAVARVADADAFATWMLDREPDAVSTTITIPAAQAEKVIGWIKANVCDPTAVSSTVTDAATKRVLGALQYDTVVGDDGQVRYDTYLVDEATGEASIPAGVVAAPVPGKLVVTVAKEAQE